MNRFQVSAILGIGILCASVIPFLLPRAAYVGSALPDPPVLSAMIALAGIIVLVIAYIFKLKPVPAHQK
ncbi:MAG: hypothetical protein RTV41_02405 [Candidatus Thorarchaeota archaeon]